MFDIIMCSSATTCQLQRDQTLLLLVKGVACETMQYRKALIKAPLKFREAPSNQSTTETFPIGLSTAKLQQAEANVQDADQA